MSLGPLEAYINVCNHRQRQDLDLSLGLAVAVLFIYLILSWCSQNREVVLVPIGRFFVKRLKSSNIVLWGKS